MKRLTLEEIGKLAGVSRATVSRVINDHPNIRTEVRERVLRVIAETGYQPNMLARSLASRETKIIGLLIPSVIQDVFSDPYYPRLTQGIAQACNKNEYTLTLFLFHTKEEEKRTLQRIIGNGLVDGIIVASDNVKDPFVPLLLKNNVTVLQVGRPTEAGSVTYVDVDNVKGGYIATKHLIDEGYQRIGQIQAIPDLVGIDRDKGYRKAFKEAGRTIDTSLIAIGDFSEESGYQAMKTLIPKQPDAVFVHSDQMAFGALRALREANLQVPDDVAIVGYDDLPIASMASPQLTTVNQPIREIGMIAAETLIDLLQNDITTPKQIILPVELVTRASTKGLHSTQSSTA